MLDGNEIICSPKTFLIKFFPWFSENFRRTLVAKCETWDFFENDLLIDERLIVEPVFFPIDCVSKDFNPSSVIWVMECCDETEDLTDVSESYEKSKKKCLIKYLYLCVFLNPFFA